MFHMRTDLHKGPKELNPEIHLISANFAPYKTSDFMTSRVESDVTAPSSSLPSGPLLLPLLRQSPFWGQCQAAEYVQNIAARGRPSRGFFCTVLCFL